MKNIFTVIVATIFVSLSAEACLTQDTLSVCPNDQVIVQSSEGTVVGINPIKQLVSVRFANGGIGTYELNEIAVSKGCIGDYCVGSRTTVSSSSGQIIGVNPLTRKVAVKFENGGIGNYELNEMSLNTGCLRQYCIGDSASVSSSSGVIVGINKISQKISVRFENGGIGNYDLDEVSVAKGCLHGYCVGDSVTVSSSVGVIVGVNREADKIAVRFENGGIGNYSLDEVSVSRGCIMGYCVGDGATVQSSMGRIIAVNPRTQKAAVRFENGGIGNYDLGEISLATYCLEFPAEDQARRVSNRDEFERRFGRKN